GKENEADEDDAEEQSPRLGVGGKLVLEEEEEGSTEDRSDQSPRAPHDHHDEHLSREQPEQKLGIADAGEWRIERAGKTPESVGDGDHGDLVEAGVVAERDRLGLVL